MASADGDALGRGRAAIEAGELAAAERDFAEAVAARPGDARALAHLAAARRRLGDLEAARHLVRRAIALDPHAWREWAHLALLERYEGRLANAIRLYERAMAIKSGSGLRTQLGMARLAAGDLRNGFRDYQARHGRVWEVPSQGPDSPPWPPGTLAGKRVLLAAEQGDGDLIQFVRLAAPLKESQSCHVTLFCRPSLAPLMATVPGIDAVVTDPGQVPRTDARALVASLPYLLGLDLATIPAAVPYLRPTRPPIRAVAEGQLSVGLAWAGNPDHREDRWRSCPFAALAPLLAVPGIRWFSLQIGERAADARGDPRVEDLSAVVGDYEGTAAVIAGLDLVVSVDTSIAHLAGALARPVWLMLSTICDWRWMADREDSPWYPTMHIFRQRRRDDWAELTGRMARALAELRGRGT